MMRSARPIRYASESLSDRFDRREFEYSNGDRIEDDVYEMLQTVGNHSSEDPSITPENNPLLSDKKAHSWISRKRWELCGVLKRFARRLAIRILELDGNALETIREDFRSDKDLVMIAVKNAGKSLKFADERLKNDREVVNAAINQDGCALEYASDDLRDDEEMVRVAIQQNRKSIEYASERLKSIFADE